MDSQEQDKQPEGKLYKTAKSLLQIHFGNDLIVFVEGRYRAVKKDIIEFLDKELDAGNKHFKLAEDQNEPLPKAPGSDLELRNKQIREFLVAQNTQVQIPDSVDPSKINLTSTADSPLTGGTNPAAPRFTQVDTVQALKNKLLGNKAVGNQVDPAAIPTQTTDAKTSGASSETK